MPGIEDDTRMQHAKNGRLLYCTTLTKENRGRKAGQVRYEEYGNGGYAAGGYGERRQRDAEGYGYGNRRRAQQQPQQQPYRRQSAADYRRESYMAQRRQTPRNARPDGIWERESSYGDGAWERDGSYGNRYDTRRHEAQSPRRKWPFVLAVLAVAALAAAVAFTMLNSCGKSDTADSGTDTANSTAQQGNQAQTSAPAAPEGRIVMTVHGDMETIVRAGESYIEGGCDARDIQEGDISDSVQASGTPDTSTPGDYEVVYTAKNAEGMVQTATRKIKVVESADWDSDGISVMMYHYVYPDADPPDTPDANLLPASMFESQLQWLVEEGYYYPSYAELSAYIAGTHSLPVKSVVLTFDDGDSTFFDVVKPLAEKYQVPVTGFIIGNRDGIAQTVKDNPSPYVNYESHSYAMHEDGTQNIGRGGAIYDFDAADVKVDCDKEREIIGSYEAFAYPYGDVSDIAPSALADNGVKEAFTIVYGQVHPGDDPMRLKRMRVFGEGSLSGFQYQVEHGPES